MLRSDLIIHLPLRLFVDYDDAQGVDCDQSPADVGTFPVTCKCEVLMAGCVVSEVCAGSSSTPVIKFDKRPAAGSDTDRGDGDIAEIKLLTAAAGKVLVDKVAEGTILTPGMEVVVQLVTAAVGSPTGHCHPFLLVAYLPETVANLTNLSETT